MVQTTNIELRGDRYRAEQLSLANTGKLLHEVRKNAAFQNLSIYAQRRNFIDAYSGEELGEIYIQIVHGAEDVIVTVPPVGKEVKKEKRKIIEVISQIVPVIRSIDNAHWIACMSGTFDGPYVHFPNTKDISDDVFYVFDSELEYHNKLISTGSVYISDGTTFPDLYLIAPTGEQPDEDGDHPEEYEWVDNSTSDSTYQYGGYSIWICPDGKLGGYRDDFSGNEYNHILKNLHVFYNEVDGLIFSLNTDHSLSRAWIVCSVAEEPGPVTEQDVVDNCGGRDYSWITQTVFFDATPGGGGLSFEDGLTTQNGQSDTPWSGSYSVRAERAIIQNFAVCYRTTETYYTATDNYPFEPCTSGETLTTQEDSSTFYCDYIRVDSEVFPLRDRTPSAFPKFFQQDIRYYNTDRGEATTALIASNKGNIETNYERWLYYYVGPNSEGDLATTEFIPESEGIYHIIPNVSGIDDDVFFGGKVFLGLVKYEIEREIDW